jgi:hypothetical protein
LMVIVTAREVKVPNTGEVHFGHIIATTFARSRSYHLWR